MKKHIFLGVNGDDCCILRCLADFDTLAMNASDIDADDFAHTSTNWNGRDDIKRTCSLRELEATGRVLLLPKPITFSGTDYDMGNEYPWTFTVKEIWEVVVKGGGE